MLSLYVQAIEKRVTELKKNTQKRASITKVIQISFRRLTSRSTLPILRKHRGFPTSISKVASPPKRRSTVRWRVKAKSGVLQFSTSARRKRFQISRRRRRSPASLHIKTVEQRSIKGRQGRVQEESMIMEYRTCRPTLVHTKELKKGQPRGSEDMDINLD